MVYQQLSSKKPERGSDFNNGVLKKFQGNISKKFLHDIQKDDHQEERTEGCIFLQISLPVLHYHGPEK